MRFDFTVRGDPLALMESHIDAAERGVTRGIRAASEGLKKDWRGQVVAAGLGQRLANTVRAATYPQKGQSISAASLAYSRAPVVVDAHDRGALIRSPTGFWLAIPIGPVQKMRAPTGIGGPNGRITPAGWEQKTGRALQFVPRPGKPPLLIDNGTPLFRRYSDPPSFNSSRRKRPAKVWTPIFLLLPQTKLRKKMDLDRSSNAWADRVPGLILENWRDVDA